MAAAVLAVSAHDAGAAMTLITSDEREVMNAALPHREPKRQERLQPFRSCGHIAFLFKEGRCGRTGINLFPDVQWRPCRWGRWRLYLVRATTTGCIQQQDGDCGHHSADVLALHILRTDDETKVAKTYAQIKQKVRRVL